ncbi:uncharacterized protein BDR25DRAFT_375123 [Lindgomyces ingoldianus]|uniref:Uncharacterized protein n=1 Tax=Lindgomyces ingoldianus TaxID=673940 RepID=A0ACB6RBY0_9PLEO|nr:uncharacterized protein BDR25DRAFT_375123 [Lindgomyces ingoldianus]KAF2476273.1 hypothetical protein BDR25DRAFT_375123 [Lindgomyces ingoldianus]
MAPHSQTVRGTFGNLKTMSAIETGRNPTQLGDPTSLHSEKYDSIPLDSMPDFSAPADPYRQNENKNKSSLADSKIVTGTMGNSCGPKVNKSMLGDSVSLKAETSMSEWGRGARLAGDDWEMRRAAERRGEYERRGRKSKL